MFIVTVSKYHSVYVFSRSLSHNSAPFYKIVVPTVDTVRYNYIVDALISNVEPVLLVGPVGTGKTSIAQNVCGKLDAQKFSVLTINMSAQTTASNVQEIIESRVEKRTKGKGI